MLASCFFLVSQKRSKSSGAGILGWMTSGEIAAAQRAETLSPDGAVATILQERKPGSSSLPSILKVPSSFS